MKKLKRYNKILSVLLLLPLMILISAVFHLTGETNTFYTSSPNVRNMLITKGSEVFLQEYFSPDDLWLAGETKKKEVWFGNQSGQDQIIRFNVTVEWFANNGTPGDLSDDTEWLYTEKYDPEPVMINWTDEITGETPSWTKINDYYYYNQVFAGGSGANPTETPPVIDSVTFSPEISNSAYTGDDFSDKSCRITIRMESLGVSAAYAEENWRATFIQEGTSLIWSGLNSR
jgi:hypothetical protein